MTRAIPPAHGTTIASLLASVTQDEILAFKPNLPKPQEGEIVLGKLGDDSLRLFFLVEEARLRSNVLIDQMQLLTTTHVKRSAESDFNRETECPAYKAAHQKINTEEGEIRAFHKVLNEIMWGTIRLNFSQYGKDGAGIGITSDFNVVETPAQPRHSTPVSLVSLLLGVPGSLKFVFGDAEDEDAESAATTAPAPVDPAG